MCAEEWLISAIVREISQLGEEAPLETSLRPDIAMQGDFFADVKRREIPMQRKGMSQPKAVRHLHT